jgi:hypothetical protein
MTLIQKLTTVIVLAICLVGAVAGEVRQAPQPLQPGSRNTASEATHQSGYDVQKERPEEAIARYNKYLAYFTAVLAVATIGLGIGIIFQIRLARAEFISTHRPRMRLKAMWLASPDGQMSVSDLQTVTPLTVRMDIVNWGNGTAFIHRINLISLVIPTGGQLPQRPPYNEPSYLGFPINNFKLISGVTFTQAFSDGRVLTPQELVDIRAGQRRLYFVGTVDYRDRAGQPRQTAFCQFLQFRHLPAASGDAGRFQREDRPAYEYEYQD